MALGHVHLLTWSELGIVRLLCRRDIGEPRLFWRGSLLERTEVHKGCARSQAARTPMRNNHNAQ